MLDWKKAKTEYITTNISYRKLADKYGTSASAICQKAKAEKWVEQRKQYINKTVTKTVEKISEKEADALAEHYRANDLMAKLLVQILEDDEKLEEMTAYWNTLEEKDREAEENYTFEEKILARWDDLVMDEFDCFFDLREWL